MRTQSRLAGALALVLVALAAACGSSPPPEQVQRSSGAGTCSSDTECGPGMACCYPCGIEGCQNACMPVRPGEGCPAIP